MWTSLTTEGLSTQSGVLKLRKLKARLRQVGLEDKAVILCDKVLTQVDRITAP